MAYDVVRKFEQTIADYCGARYGVAVSSCTNAIFLCLKYGWDTQTIELPKHTYVGVAMSILNAGYKIKWGEDEWFGSYFLRPTPICDSALRFERNMHIPDRFTCLSFHNRKHIPIGRGGMILTDSWGVVDWLKQARYDGRLEKPSSDQPRFVVQGYNMYMTPEQASRGLVLFNNIRDKRLPDIDDYDTYPDLSEVMKPLLRGNE